MTLEIVFYRSFEKASNYQENSHLKSIMKSLLLTILLLMTQVTAASDDFRKINIEQGIVLSVKKFNSYRSLPHSYFDQAIASIPIIYPEHVFFAKRRYGKLGEMQYSIICYKENEKKNSITISGIAVLKSNAWSFETRVPQESFGDYLLIVLESIQNLPSNKAFQPTAESGG